MSDIGIEHAVTLEQLRERVLNRIGHLSKADTVEDLLEDVVRISRAISVPPDFMNMLREAAASGGGRSIVTVATDARKTPLSDEWMTAIALLERGVPFGELKEATTNATGYPFRSRVIWELLADVKRIGKTVRIPEMFVAGLERAVVRGADERRRRMDDWQRAMMLLGRGGNFTALKKVLWEVTGYRCRSLGLEQFLAEVKEMSSTVYMPDEFIAALEAVVARKCKRGEGGRKGAEPETGIESSRKSRSTPAPERQRAGSNHPMGFTRVVKQMQWVHDHRYGRIDLHSNPIEMGYGFALLAPGHGLVIRSPRIGDVAFAMCDRVTGVSVAGSFPRWIEREWAQGRLNELAGSLSGRFYVTKKFDKVKRQQAEYIQLSASPYEFEFLRMALDLKGMNIPTERMSGRMFLVGGRGSAKRNGETAVSLESIVAAGRSVGFDLNHSAAIEIGGVHEAIAVTDDSEFSVVAGTADEVVGTLGCDLLFTSVIQSSGMAMVSTVVV